ncbi:hypothetical protein [Kitasatospora sp. LaBMicrA B282]
MNRRLLAWLWGARIALHGLLTGPPTAGRSPVIRSGLAVGR